ncbi:MAG: peptidoglycan DD-metalloendopeptidase family protein [Bacteroidetes bacterium]|nr:peptidoglycan DD-metalloendopeptidase family protein [Bacteroidota bacterium]
MKNLIRNISILLLICSFWPSQSQTLSGSGEYGFQAMDYMSDSLSKAIDAQVRANSKLLQAKGMLPHNKTSNPSFDWPAKVNAGFPYCSYWGISFFVDHDTNNPNHVLDFNCGSRTYDMSGFNHDGTDIFLWPFPQYLQDQGYVEVIAAAPGILVYKADGYPDHSCIISNQYDNEIVILHSNGIYTYYGHLKKNSLTTKNIGDTIALGETVGKAGSSGASSGPHLHFGVKDSLSHIIDPFTGPCNAGNSMWTIPRTYYTPNVNAALTHSSMPVFNPCPGLETLNLKDTFNVGDTFYCIAYLRDQTIGDTLFMSLTAPDNTVYDWTFIFTISYNNSWVYEYCWYDVTDLPGNWKFTARYKGSSCEHNFVFASPLSTNQLKIAPDDAFTISPNPATGFFRISSKHTEDAGLYDRVGNKIMSLKTNGNYDVSNIPGGIYIIRSSNHAAKIVIQGRN